MLFGGNMHDIILYHHPRCSKSRQVKQLLTDKSLDFQCIEYLKTPLDRPTLLHIIALLGVSPRALIRQNEAIFKTLDLDTADDAALLDALVAHPILLQRPIVVVDNARAAIGRPPECVLSLFESTEV